MLSMHTALKTGCEVVSKWDYRILADLTWENFCPTNCAPLMNARIITLLTTIVIALSASRAGEFPSQFYSGVWTGFNGQHGPGITGGTLSFSLLNNTDVKQSAAVSNAG